VKMKWKCCLCQKEYETEGFCAVICSVCADNAKLGAMVRADMKIGDSLNYFQDGWTWTGEVFDYEVDEYGEPKPTLVLWGKGSTPEEALEKAGVKP